jgi:hypothetical protein
MSKKKEFFIVTAVKTSDLIFVFHVRLNLLDPNSSRLAYAAPISRDKAEISVVMKFNINILLRPTVS